MTGSFNCWNCGACCKLVPEDMLKLYGLPVSENGGCGNLDNNRCKIYDTRPDICDVKKTWEKFHKDSFSFDEYCELSYEVCKILEARLNEQL